MKALTTILLSLMAASQVSASWAFMELRPKDLERNADAALKPVLSGYPSIYISGPDFRQPTLEYDKDKKEFNCRIPISYVEVVDWISLSHVDTIAKRWTQHPKEAKKDDCEECSNLTQLVAVLDGGGLDFTRVTAVRTESKTGRFLAAWNYLEITVPEQKKGVLSEFLKRYFQGLKQGDSLSVYR